MTRYAVISAAALALSSQAYAVPPAAELQATPLQPNGPWRVDSSQAACRLLRQFGTGSSALTFMVIQGAGPSRYDAILAGPAIPELPKRISLELRLMPQGPSQTFEASSAAIPNQAGRIISWFDAEASFLQGLEASPQLGLSGSDGLAISIDMRGAKAAIAALGACQDELLRIWGIDSEALKALRDLPKPDVAVGGGNPRRIFAQSANMPKQPIDPGSWASWQDYPSEALRREVSGSVVMALSLNSTGRV